MIEDLVSDKCFGQETYKYACIYIYLTMKSIEKCCWVDD